jgi:hypothetical protein
MINNRRVIADNHCDIIDLIEPIVDDTFYEFVPHLAEPGAIYVFTNKNFQNYRWQIKTLTEQGVITPVYFHPAEGSETMKAYVSRLDIADLLKQGKVPIVTGGYVPDNYDALYYENFLPKILAYPENIAAIEEYNSRHSYDRPYKFLFLNGRARAHRVTLMRKLNHLLDQAIWSNLDKSAGPLKLLDPHYEVDFYKDNITNFKNEYNEGYIKYNLFNKEWGEIYLAPNPYLDTYFSLVGETVFDYPYTFRTEKIWKPIAIGHPWIVAANYGYYRDLRNMGFKTFEHLIDESFDLIEGSEDRASRIAVVVEDLCKQDLPSFLRATEDVCKYNQQLMADLGPKLKQEFLPRFIQYINERS